MQDVILAANVADVGEKKSNKIKKIHMVGLSVLDCVSQGLLLMVDSYSNLLEAASCIIIFNYNDSVWFYWSKSTIKRFSFERSSTCTLLHVLLIIVYFIFLQ